jgi:Signal transduction histidine kinase
MKRIMSLIFALIISLLSFAGTQQQDIRYHNISMQDGLRSNAVRNIVQDKFGFVWLGTDNGLCRYDGTSVHYYTILQQGTDQYISALQNTENGLLVGTAHGAFLFDYKSETFIPFAKVLKKLINHFTSDADGNIWIATMGQGVARYSPKTKTSRIYQFKANKGNISQVFVDSRNQIFAISNWGKYYIYKLNKATNEFVPLNTRGGNYGSLAITKAYDGSILLGTWENGLCRINDDGSIETLLDPSISGTAHHIHTLFAQSSQSVLIGCDDGLISYNPQTGEWHVVNEHAEERASLSERFIYSIMRDNEGGLWFGTFYGGANYLSPVGERFSNYTCHGKGNGFCGNVISRFCEDNNGSLWIASDDGGLSRMSVSTHQIVPYPGSSVLSKYNVHALCNDGKYLWIGTYTNGIIRLEKSTGAMKKYTQQQGLYGSSSYAIYKDHNGKIWAATMEGINLYDPVKDSFHKICATEILTIDIKEDKNGFMWFATQGGGIIKYNVATKKIKIYRHSKRQGSIPSDQVNCIHIGENAQILIATSTGICSYDQKTDTFNPIPLNIDIKDVGSIIEDQGILWISTTHGIIRYVKGEGLQLFNRYDGLYSEIFQPNAGIKTSDGCIYFGTTSGFIGFYPYQIKANNIPPAVYITGLELFNKPVNVGDDRLPESLNSIKKLNLSYKDHMFSISFASLSYCSPEKNQYAYMLDGFDKEWNYVGNQHKATYTNIPAGTYTFRVKATNNDGLWSSKEATLLIVIHPPFWWTLPAKLIYIILILAAIYFSMQYKLKGAENKHKEEIRKLNIKQEEDTRKARLNFFTMIAHEIRTPVTLIIGPLESIKNELCEKHSAFSSQLSIIDRNAHRLLELVNQLLDFSKVQQQGLLVNYDSCNIAELLSSVAERFAPSFHQKGISFSATYPPKDFVAVIDREGITKVVSNLMSNALKYSRSLVKLDGSVNPVDNTFTIVVEDDGEGISKTDLKRIFNPFFQASDNKPGTGIGLSIVKQIVEQHHGTVNVVSEKGKGAKFIITLSDVINEKTDKETVTCESISQEDTNADSYQSDELDKNTQSNISESVPTMLIVDDDPDMLAFISSNFAKSYTLFTAQNGVEALEILHKKTVSLIVSDWMMPEMDGAELCRRIRKDYTISHIPFIMLTAKTDNDSKAESMDCGADAYIEKPFSMKYLEACIRNMIEMRHLLMQKFSSLPSEPISRIANTTVDDEFLTRMNAIIEDNISNTELNVAFLASELGISRSGLFAKIKALADVTPNEMIQVIRLRRAAVLLQQNKYRINEVCYMVGFNSPSYFTKCFQKQFGTKPGEHLA